ncbi:MAG TPA: PIN domain-containing protein [Chloroflexota bacterium]
MALIDTGALVALIDVRDGRNARATRLLRDLPGYVRTTWAVITETLHLLGTAAESRGTQPWHGQALLARRLQDGHGLVVADFTAALGRRSLDLMREYADRPMDFADASLVALAETTGDLRIITFDADSRIYRTADGRALEILNGSV